MKNELTVYCVCVGNKYHSGYVYALKEMVSKYLTIPHKFVCITDRVFFGIETIKPPLDYKSWWAKMGLFKVTNGPSIFFDLDIVLVKNVDYLADHTDSDFAAPANWAQSGWGGIQSSVMCWNGRSSFLYDAFIFDPDAYMKSFHGDQEYIYKVLGNDWERIEGIGSYKYHIRPPQGIGEIPDWMNVCVFHGDPKPHEVKQLCLSQYTLVNKYIMENMQDGLQKDLRNMV